MNIKRKITCSKGIKNKSSKRERETKGKREEEGGGVAGRPQSMGSPLVSPLRLLSGAVLQTSDNYKKECSGLL